MQSDEELWRLAVRGNGVAFAAIFDRHGDRVWRHAWRLMQHRQETEDVTSAAFFELWRKRRTVRIVDGSILPSGGRSGPHATTMMMACRIGDVLAAG